MKEPIWVNKKVAIAMHDRQLAEHGGGTGVRDEGMLESALARAQNLFLYGDGNIDWAALAAAYAYGIASNHPFVDGNKRTALVASITFLFVNEIPFEATQEEAYLTILKLAAGELSEQELADWYRQHIKEVKQ